MCLYSGNFHPHTESRTKKLCYTHGYSIQPQVFWMPSISLSPVIQNRLFYFLLVSIVLFGIHERYLVTTQTVVDLPVRADAGDYFSAAYHLRFHSVFSRQSPDVKASELVPDATRPPGFPAFAAPFMSMDLDASLRNVLLAQTLVQILSFLGLTWLLVKLVHPSLALLGALVMWTFPHFISVNSFFVSESLFISALSALMVFVYMCVQNRKLNGYMIFLIGLFIGVMALIRPTMEYLTIFIVLLTYIFGRTHFRQALLLLLGSLIPILGWKIRNYFAIGSFSDPTLLINALLHGSYPGFVYDHLPESFGFPYRFDPDAPRSYEGVGTTLLLIWERASQAPLEYLSWYLWGKQTFLWQWGIINGAGDIFLYPVISTPFNHYRELFVTYSLHGKIHVYWVISGLVISLYYFANYLWKRQNNQLLPFLLSALVVYVSLFHMIVAPFPRYGIPFKLPLIFLVVLFLNDVLCNRGRSDKVV